MNSGNLKFRYGILGITLIFAFALLFLYDASRHKSQEFKVTPSKWDISSKQKYLNDARPTKKVNAVILLSMIRSGSSIVGSIFNERSNILYLYEPLFPFGKQKCDEKTRQELLEVLRQAISCHFENLGDLYHNSTRDDTGAR